MPQHIQDKHSVYLKSTLRDIMSCCSDETCTPIRVITILEAVYPTFKTFEFYFMVVRILFSCPVVDSEVLCYLIECCPRLLEFRDAEQKTLLHCLVIGSTSSTSAIEKAIKQKPSLVSQVCSSGDTPLRLLLKQPLPDSAVAKLLIDADPSALFQRNDAGDLPIHELLRACKWHGCHGGALECLRLLLRVCLLCVET